jgi:hypothetical protein
MNEREKQLSKARETYLRQPWMSERAKLFSEITIADIQLNEVQVQLKNLDSGWLDFYIYIDGIEKATINLSRAMDPLPNIKRWLEQIGDDTLPIAAVDIDEEGHHAIMCYEHLSKAQYEIIKCNDKFDAETCYDIGLFYVYETSDDRINAYAVCKTKELINTIYMKFLCFSGFNGASKKRPLNFLVDWYYDNIDYSDNKIDESCNNWTFYNEIKSPLIEWNISNKEPYRCTKPTFKPYVKVNEMIQMWAEWGDALFWVCDGCCGDCSTLYCDTGIFDLSNITGLKEWYDEFNNSLSEEPWSENRENKWYQRGYKLALQIREILPDNIELCYYWLTFKHDIEDVQEPLRLIPNKHCWIEH